MSKTPHKMTRLGHGLALIKLRKVCCIDPSLRQSVDIFTSCQDVCHHFDIGRNGKLAANFLGENFLEPEFIPIL